MGEKPESELSELIYPAEQSLDQSSLNAEGVCVLSDVSVGDTILPADAKIIVRKLNVKHVWYGGDRWSRLKLHTEGLRCILLDRLQLLLWF